MPDLPRLDSNLHTHTYRCKHADGEIDDYCEAAVSAGLTTLGISDHTPLPDDRWLSVRMPYSERSAYMQRISNVQQRFPQLNILRSAECEFDDDYVNFYREELLGVDSCDYLIGAAHYFPHEGKWISPFNHMNQDGAMKSFAEYFIRSMESGLFAFMAHPDNFMASRYEFNEETARYTHEICAAAESLNSIWEINGYGFRKSMVESADGLRLRYPYVPFWDIVAEYKIRVVVNSDAHSPEDVALNLDDAAQVALDRNLHICSVEEVLAFYE